MSKQPADKIGRLAVALAVFAFVSLGYIYSVAHRLDWVRYITKPYYWRVEALSCPGKKAQAVVVLSDKANSSPKHTLNYDPDLYSYLKTLSAAQPVKVEIQRKGYLWEFNYGEEFVLAIGTKGIYQSWRKTPRELDGCTYEPATTLDPSLLSTQP